MDKRKIALATFMAVSASAVAISGSPVSAAENEQWISKDSGIIVNPSVMGSVTAAKVASVANLAASNLTELTTLMEKELEEHSTLITIQYTGKTANLSEELGDIIDNVRMKDDYLNGTLSTWTYGYKGFENNVTITLKFTYHTTPQQEAFIQSEVERIVDEIITPTMSTVEKVKAINDYIVLNTTYSENTTTTPHAAYAILNEGKGVCQAYALLAYRLLQEAGIEARYVTGVTRNEGHAWNLVKVDGQWYHLDTTWNDPTFADSSVSRSDYISYKYFLITDNAIKKDHIIDNNGYPAATNERFMAFSDMRNPVQVGSELYFPSNTNDIQLYKLDLSKEPYKTQKVSTTRVQELVYADGWLYFSNYSNGAYLYKMKLDGSSEKMLLQKKVDTVKLDGNDLVASYNGVELYREAVLDDTVVGQQNELDQIKALVNSIVLLSPTFETEASQLKNLYSSLTNESKNLLTGSERTSIQNIFAKSEAMKNLTFGETIQWEQLRTITDPKKNWKVNLSQNVANTAANKAQIQMVDMFGDSVDANISINGKEIVVTPTDNYVANIPYTLIVNPGLLSEDGTKVKNGVYLQFKLQ